MRMQKETQSRVYTAISNQLVFKPEVQLICMHHAIVGILVQRSIQMSYQEQVVFSSILKVYI